MATSRNPYREWFDHRISSDHRDKTTQLFSLTRQQLSQPEYLLDENRVNPGPWRNARARRADSLLQVPHNLTYEDMWGYQGWANANKCRVANTETPGLFKRCSDTDIAYDGVTQQPDSPPGSSHTI